MKPRAVRIALAATEVFLKELSDKLKGMGWSHLIGVFIKISVFHQVAFPKHCSTLAGALLGVAYEDKEPILSQTIQFYRRRH